MKGFDYQQYGIQIRKDILESVRASGRGHIPSAFSLVEILAVLYQKILIIDPKFPDNELRDKLILSKGHGCLALYSILADRGFFPKTELSKFCRFDGMLGGHPEHTHIPGVEASTGALGHGLSIGVGMALAAKIDNLGNHVYVILGDGECNEGSIWEAALSASHKKLGNLTVLIDYNKYQSYGKLSQVVELEPFSNKWESFGFHVSEVNMDFPFDLENLLCKRKNSLDKSHVVICHTVKGKGISEIENSPMWHHKSKVSSQLIDQLINAMEA